MMYSTQHGTVNFWDPYPQLEQYKKIGINLSAGTDSALLMFLTCRQLESRPNHSIIPVTGVDIERPTNEWNAREIVDLFTEWFPNVNIQPHQVFYYKKEHEKDKARNHKENEMRLFKDEIIDILFHGRTSNPPLEEAEKYNLMYKREERRDVEGKERPVFVKRFYTPFDYVDKRFIADLYHRFNLMEDLFPITASCIEKAKKTDNFTKPCKECWWCREKKWAFGMYDGGVL